MTPSAQERLPVLPVAKFAELLEILARFVNRLFTELKIDQENQKSLQEVKEQIANVVSVAQKNPENL